MFACKGNCWQEPGDACIYCQVLAAVVRCCQVLADVCRCWEVLAGVDMCWQVLVCVGRCCQLLAQAAKGGLCKALCVILSQVTL